MRKTVFTAYFAVLVLAAAALCRPGPAFADQEMTPVPLAFASEPSGSTIFTMMPPRLGTDYKVVREGYGIAYRVDRDGALKEIYRTQGWYSFKVHVSADGRYLVQMGPWNRGIKPEKDHLAVAFHKDGKLLKRYSTVDLIKDPSKVKSSVSHYMWLQPDYADDLSEIEIQGLAPHIDYDNCFTLHTIDGWTYVFDVTTGNIKRSHLTRQPKAPPENPTRK